MSTFQRTLRKKTYMFPRVLLEEITSSRCLRDVIGKPQARSPVEVFGSLASLCRVDVSRFVHLGFYLGAKQSDPQSTILRIDASGRWPNMAYRYHCVVLFD